MNLSKEWVGTYVAVQFARPLYMFEYGAHVKDVEGSTQLVPMPKHEPAMGPDGKPGARMVARDFAIGLVTSVTDGLTLELTIPNESQQSVTLMLKTVAPELVMAIDIVFAHEAPVPQAVRHQRERVGGGTQSKIIL